MVFVLIEMWIDGTTPLLQNRATEEDLSGTTRRNTATEPENPRLTCDKHIYRLSPSKQIAVPGGAFARMLREAGGSHKAKGSRKSVKYIVPAAVTILDELCGLYLNDRKTQITDFEVDSRPVTIPSTKGKVMRHRARFNEWSCRVQLRINTSILDEKLVRQMMGEGLSQIGIGDNRPEKGGPFGTSGLVIWKEISVPAPLNVAQLRNTKRKE
jgi:hypothetical protein